MKPKNYKLGSYWKDPDRLLSLVSDSTKPFNDKENSMLYQLEAEDIRLKNLKGNS